MRDWTAPVEINFGSLKPTIPEGWRVVWSPLMEHYMGEGPDEWESAIHWDRYAVRRWVIAAARDAT